MFGIRRVDLKKRMALQPQVSWLLFSEPEPEVRGIRARDKSQHWQQLKRPKAELAEREKARECWRVLESASGRTTRICLSPPGPGS